MRRTTVYLSDEEADGLRRVSAETGTSQSELIRAGVRAVIGRPESERVFHSLGRGSSGGQRRRRWGSGELYDKAFGRRPSAS
jgi:Arc/MetJ-type ribon-helix-helix transcriptional regulator